MYLLELTERTHFLHDLNTYIDSTAPKYFTRASLPFHTRRKIFVSYGRAMMRALNILARSCWCSCVLKIFRLGVIWDPLTAIRGYFGFWIQKQIYEGKFWFLDPKTAVYWISHSRDSPLIWNVYVKVLNLIGKGGFASVYRAISTPSGQVRKHEWIQGGFRDCLVRGRNFPPKWFRGGT